MALEFPSGVYAPRNRVPESILSFVGFPHGLNTNVSVFQLQKTECSELVNFDIKKGGVLVTRRGLQKYSNSSVNNAIITISYVKIQSQAYILIQDSDYKIYYLDSNLDPVLIGQVNNRAEIVNYNGAAIILDGSYIKYINNINEPIKMAYDDGSGTRGFLFDQRTYNQDIVGDLGKNNISRIATKFTTPSWDSGYTLKPTEVGGYFASHGSPNGTVTACIRKVSDDSIIASKTIISDTTKLTPVLTLYFVRFEDSDITSELQPNTDYYLSFETTINDSLNYIQVGASNVSGKSAYQYDGSSWSSQSDTALLCYLKPGLPPKSSFGVVKDLRLFSAGDPDNPGYVWVSNLSYLDWSTPLGGGYIGVIDDHKEAYKVGGMNILYGDLLIYGTQEQPYISKLQGNSPENYSLPMTFQKTWATHRAIVSVVNDLWAGSGDGVDPITGVTEYGDLRTFSASDPIDNIIKKYWETNTAFAGYYPKNGQYWLVMPKYSKVLVAHTKIPIPDPYNVGNRYPWVEFQFYKALLTDTNEYEWVLSSSGSNEYYVQKKGGGDPSLSKPDFLLVDDDEMEEGTVGSLTDSMWGYGDNDSLGFNTVYFCSTGGDPSTQGYSIRSVFLPTALANHGEDLYIGGSDGFVYIINETSYKDMDSVDINPRMSTAYIQLPFNYANFIQFQMLATSETGGSLGIYFFKDGQMKTGAISVTKTFSIPDNLLVKDASMYVDDATFVISHQTLEAFHAIDFNARSLMVTLKNIVITGDPIYINGILLRYRRLSH